MKRFILVLGILVCILAAHLVFGQVNEGSITYEVKVNMHRTLPADRQEMKEMIPEFDSFKNILMFKESESVYKLVEEDDVEEFGTEGQGGGMRMRMRRPSAEFYFNQNLSKRIKTQEFFGKKYIIEDSIRIMPWKFGQEEKTILGYKCKAASYYNEERKQNVTAWFTDQLKPFLGPESYNTLPGTVLQVNINEGERIITAISKSEEALKKGDIKVPSNGERISEVDFRKMVEEQMKKMGGRGNIIIRN